MKNQKIFQKIQNINKNLFIKLKTLKIYFILFINLNFFCFIFVSV